MASREEFVVTLYNFEPEHEEGEESSNSSESEYSDGSDEEFFGWLVILDWCKCSPCTATTLRWPNTVLARAFTDAN